MSASDEERLPPGGFSLRHGFPEWFGPNRPSSRLEEAGADVQEEQSNQDMGVAGDNISCATRLSEELPLRCGAVEIAQVLYYMRGAFDSETLLDQIPLEAAGNPGAWHAWQARRDKTHGRTPSAARPEQRVESPSHLVQRPGGARRPGQWNWEGVWEERVKKGIHASISQTALFTTGQDSDLVGSSVYAYVTVNSS